MVGVRHNGDALSEGIINKAQFGICLGDLFMLLDVMSNSSKANLDEFDTDHLPRGTLAKQIENKSTCDFWRCSVCTYDNDDSLLFCELCGALHDSPNVFENKGENEVYSIRNNSISVMAKALFARMPHRTTKKSSPTDLPLRIDSMSDEFNAKASLNTLHERFTVLTSKRSVSIVPFRFDILSPDDMVSQGKNFSRMHQKDKYVPSIPNMALPSGLDENEVVRVLPHCEELDTSPACLYEVVSNIASTDDVKSQILSCNLPHLKLDKRSKNNKKAIPLDKYKPGKWVYEQGLETLSQLNIAVVGHVDSGKSTLCGRLLHLLGRISNKEIHKYQKEAKEKGKGSFAYAWAMDDSVEERERGITMTVAIAHFESKNSRVVLLDSPGHKDFVPNMISGVAQADAAILVVDASKGSFEAGMGIHGVGQTKEHAQLIRSFGVEQIVVAVNKMDAVQYAQERFDYIKFQLSSFLRSCGFKETHITWIPLSAMENQNLVTLASDVRLIWYHGVCLLDAIDSLYTPERDVFKPLLLPICDVISSHSLGQIAACGKLEAGAIRQGSKVLVMPSGELATVRYIERDSQACALARTGDHVAVSLQGLDGVNLVPGGVLCHPDFPVSIASLLELKILVLDIKMPILIGSHVEFHIHHAKEAARVTKIISLINQKGGDTSKGSRLLVSRQSAIIEVSLDRPVCVEEFSGCRALGRVVLRASGVTVAVGIVSRVIAEDLP
ncbi:hypothetical protein HPP92_028135 [Vanilla planifolia]|uniref:Tr-type G domain-containing protein n=1 Tax=Vanilla planifolia TaxID=51239 RepID=A0A835P7B7_VANPL|nr:hypothetical protein HPP92_028135 [Vanilla planifolia]KAG0447889.1 hypothetical protein HPP92_028114 [Vanilla planifolia]